MPEGAPIVIVTGAARRHSIGRTVAELVARAGYGVVCSDVAGASTALTPEERAAGWRGIHTIEERLRDDGHTVAAIECDLRDRGQMRSVVDLAASLGRIHGLVNSARAPLGAVGSSSEIAEEDWDRTMAINVRGPLFLSIAVAEGIAEAGGSIVNISSTGAFSPVAGRLAYSTSKAAMNMMTRGLSAELAPRGIRVNAVCPGPTATNRVSVDDQRLASSIGGSSEEVRRANLSRLASTIPMGRVATTEDVAEAVLFFLSDASCYITGELLVVGGGAR